VFEINEVSDEAYDYIGSVPTYLGYIRVVSRHSIEETPWI
jgi:hypothetical protein